MEDCIWVKRIELGLAGLSAYGGLVRLRRNRLIGFRGKSGRLSGVFCFYGELLPDLKNPVRDWMWVE